MVTYGRFLLFLALLYARWKIKLDQSKRRVDRLRAGLIWQCAGHIDITAFRDVTSCSLVEVHRCSGTITSPSVTQQPNSGLGRFIVEVPITHTHALPVRLLWKCDCLVAEAAIQHTTNTRDKHICPHRGSNPRPKAYTFGCTAIEISLIFNVVKYLLQWRWSQQFSVSNSFTVPVTVMWTSDIQHKNDFTTHRKPVVHPTSCLFAAYRISCVTDDIAQI